MTARQSPSIKRLRASGKRVAGFGGRRAPRAPGMATLRQLAGSGRCSPRWSRCTGIAQCIGIDCKTAPRCSVKPASETRYAGALVRNRLSWTEWRTSMRQDGSMTEVETRQPSALVGLSPDEVLARRARGLGNDVELVSSRSYRQIFSENVFTFINCVLFSLGLALVALGRISDALVSVGVVGVNVVVSVVQEVRAKRTLDCVALLTQPRATVLRG